MNRVMVMKRLCLVLGVLVLVSGAGDAAFALLRTAPASPSLIRLSWTEDPATSMTVTWQDAAGAEDAWVEYAEEEATSAAWRKEDAAAGAAGTESGAAAAVPTGILRTAGTLVPHASTISDGGTQYVAKLTALRPDTKYSYRVVSSTGRSAVASFRTAPAEKSAPVSFAYFGDVQVAARAEEEFADWGALAQGALAAHPELAFGMMGGDIVESGISAEQFNLFFDAASSVFSRIPLFATNGNHESNFIGGKPELYLDSFSLPENGPEGFSEEFYSFEYSNLHVTVLNSWVFSGEQKIDEAGYTAIREWIRRDLAETDCPWKVVVMHHPLYEVHNDHVARAVRENWGSVLEEGGVDLVLCGHQHVYARSLPMTDGLVDYANGITQIMGVSGEKFYSSADETNQERTVYEQSNYQVIRIQGDSMEVQCFDRNGKELDYAVIAGNHRGETGQPGQGETAAAYADVRDGDWFRPAVAYVTGRGYFEGVGDGRFAPDVSMTRAMFVTVLGRLAGVDAARYGGSAFADVPSEAWYAPYVRWAAEEQIVNGVGNDRFAPETPVTREQMAAILYRYAAMAGQDTAADRARFDAFSDSGRVALYAVPAFVWATDRQIVNGTGTGLEPQGTATRAQVAQIIMKYEQKVS